MLVCREFNIIGSRSEADIIGFVDLDCQGREEMEIICPVSKLTGFPMSMQQAIMFISDDNSRIADALFQEVPLILSSDEVSDDDKLKTLISRLDTGSFFENDRAAEALAGVVKEFMPNADKSIIDAAVKQNTDNIQFEKSDAPSVDA